MRQELAAKKLPVAAAAVGNRIAFAASMLEGRSVIEQDPRSAGAEEIGRLTQEIRAQF